MYMPSHEEDIRIIPKIMHIINTQIIAHPNHTHIICGDFKKDIALIGKQNEHGIIPPFKNKILGGERTSIIYYFPISLPIQHTLGKADSTIQTLAS